MDRLKQYIETAQNKTSQEKHSIALVIASAVSGGLFVVWLGVALYNINAGAPSSPIERTPTESPTAEIQKSFEEVINVPQEDQSPTYVDLDSVPAVYRPDSVGQPVTNTQDTTPTTTPPQDTTVQGSDTPTNVIE